MTVVRPALGGLTPPSLLVLALVAAGWAAPPPAGPATAPVAAERPSSTATVPLRDLPVVAAQAASLQGPAAGVPGADPSTAGGRSDGDPGAGLVVVDHVPDDEVTLTALTWPRDAVPADAVVEVRVREDVGWSDWQALDVEAGLAAEEGSDVVGTEPFLSGGADRVQVRLPDDLTAQATLVLVDGGSADVVAPSASLGGYSGPSVISRGQWGADESLARSTSTNTTVKAVVVHHTASTSTYEAGEASAQVRSVYRYHTVSLGWSDIGYHFLVDRFGRATRAGRARSAGRCGARTQRVQRRHHGHLRPGQLRHRRRAVGDGADHRRGRGLEARPVRP